MGSQHEQASADAAEAGALLTPGSKQWRDELARIYEETRRKEELRLEAEADAQYREEKRMEGSIRLMLNWAVAILMAVGLGVFFAFLLLMASTL